MGWSRVKPDARAIHLEEKEEKKRRKGSLCVCVYVYVYLMRRGEKGREREAGEINISATWPLKPLPMTANIMKRYGRQARGGKK